MKQAHLFRSSLRRTALAVAAALPMPAGAADEPRQLRVCADPDNLPFSNQRLEGFENEVAQLIAKDLNATVQYTWMPQRRGFIRQTLKAGHCDLVTGVPSNLEMVLSTEPYYSSTYVFVYKKNRNVRIDSFDDPALRDLKIGLHAIGDDGAGPPPVHALAKRGLVKNVVGFKMQDVESVENPQGRIIEAVATGDIDVAIVWGPFGGYFAKQQPTELEVVPVTPPSDKPAFPYVYDISMGVRHGESSWKAELQGILDRRRSEIRGILEKYGVPLVDSARLGSQRH